MTRFGSLRTAQAIAAATKNAAVVLGLEQEIGSIRSGGLADVTAVPANPFKDISALTNVVFVMHRGKILVGS